MNNNPLLQKYEELYGKKEPPKPVEKSIKFKSYDIDDLKKSFQIIAEQVNNDKSIVSSMNMERDMMTGTKITFEVMVYDP